MTTLTLRAHGESVESSCSSLSDHVMNGFFSQASAARSPAHASIQTIAAPSRLRLTVHLPFIAEAYRSTEHPAMHERLKYTIADRRT